MTPNPFTYGNPIRTPERFFGRTEELRQIVNRLRSARMKAPPLWENAGLARLPC